MTQYVFYSIPCIDDSVHGPLSYDSARLREYPLEVEDDIDDYWLKHYAEHAAHASTETGTTPLDWPVVFEISVGPSPHDCKIVGRARVRMVASPVFLADAMPAPRNTGSTATRSRGKPMKKHTCKENSDCLCGIDRLEPDDRCPVHGGSDWPPRCEICGRFVSRPPIKALDGMFNGEAHHQ